MDTIKIQPTMQTQIEAVAADPVADRLPLADQLGSEEGIRQVIQILVDQVQTLSDKVTALEQSTPPMTNNVI